MLYGIIREWMMKTIYLVVGIALFACCHVNSAPLDVMCGDESCRECFYFLILNLRQMHEKMIVFSGQATINSKET